MMISGALLDDVEDLDEEYEDLSGSSEGEEESGSESDDGDVRMKSVEEENAEEAIEGDFDRLVKDIRLRDGSSANTGLLAKDWDFNLEEHEAEFRNDLREASGVGRRRRKRGRVAGPVLSQQVKALIGDGNQAYVDNNIPEAIRVMNEVIRIEPRAVSAWSVLAQCYEDMKEDEKGLQLRIIAAHLRHDTDEWERLARHSRELGYNKQSLYCYSKLSSLDPSNVDVLWDKASLAKEIGDFRTAKNAFLAILKCFPHDLTVLRELHAILMELSDLPTCLTLLQNALDHYVATFPSGSGRDPVTGLVVPGGGFSNLDLLLLADLYNALGDYDKAVHTIRRGTRWLQGRLDQKYWDMCEDDREYDQDGWPQRSTVGEGGTIQPGHFELDTNARHRLAVARIKMGDIEEGRLHANCVLSEEVLDYSVLFAEIADAYFEREMYSEAKPIYEMLGGDAATSSIYILLQTAACMRNVDELKEAAEVYEHVKLADPTNNDAKMKLAEIYEVLGETRKALDLVYEVIDSRKKRPKEQRHAQTRESTATAGTSLFAEEKTQKNKGITVRTQNRLNYNQLRELEAQKEKEVIAGYRKLKELWPALLASDPEAERLWLLEAEKLVEMFRETRNLFLTTRANFFKGMFPRNRRRQQSGTEGGEERMASRLQLDLERDTLARKSAREKAVPVNIFRGVHFDEWMKIFMQYCFTITKLGRFDDADEILRHIMVSNAYQSKERQDCLRLALATCAIHAERHEIIVEQIRKMIGAHQFNNEPFRILLASVASGLKVTDAFITSTLQKHLFREMKLWDAAVHNPETIKWSTLNKRYAPLVSTKSGDGGLDDEDDGVESTPAPSVPGKSKIPDLPSKDNPLIVTLYGQLCIAAKSYQSAIFYLLHAYDYYPNDPMICLCLTIASIGRAMQRQSDNRHHLVVQGMAFFTQYRKLRGTSDAGVREVEYNMGRMFHQLGLYSHAVKHYERVLELADKAGDRQFAPEAAYNLAFIFSTTGAKTLAQELYKRWLSI